MNKRNSHQQFVKDDQQLQSYFVFNRSPSDYFLNHFCTRFVPLQEFFANQHPLTIRRPVPIYSQTTSKTYRNNLKPDRQLQYLRRAIGHDYCDSATRELLADQEYQRYYKLGNISLYSNDRLLWAEGTKVMQLVVDDVLSLQSESKISSLSLNKAKQLIDVHEIILELKLTQGQILARSSRILFMFDPDKVEETIIRYAFDSEVVAVWSYSSQDSLQIFVSLTDGHLNRIKHINISSKNQQTLLQTASQIPFNSGWSLTRNESILCDESKVYAYDARMKKTSTLSTLQLKSNRIFTGISLDLSPINRCFGLAQSFVVGLYDLRKPSQPVLQLCHHCQESPPTILQLVENHASAKKSRKQLVSSLLLDNHQNPIIIAHSPYAQGSALFAQLKKGWAESKSSPFFNRESIGFQLLFDRGKLDNNFCPRSLSVISSNKHVYFFSVDNMSGVSLQIFKRESASKTLLNPKIPQAIVDGRLQRLRFGRNVELEERGNNAWFRREVLKKYVKQKEDQYWKKQLLDYQMDLEIVENDLESRYLRFADLKQFYHELFHQAQTNNPVHQIQQENAKISCFLKNESQQHNFSYPTMETTLASSLQEEDCKEVPQADWLSFRQLLELHEDWQKD